MRKAKVIRDKGFYRLTLGIAIPIALQNSIGFLVNMVDTVMLGSVGQMELSASQLANQPFFIFSLLGFGLTGGASVLCSQYWGKKDLGAIRQVISIAVWVMLVASILFGAAAVFFPTQVMQIYTNDAQMIELGAKYLQVMGFSYPLFGVYSVLTGAIRSVGIVKIAVICSVCSFGTNVFLNWVLIFGNLGAPALGVEGAAIATVFARVVEFAVALVYILCIDKKLKFRLRYMLQVRWWLFKDFIRTATPVALNELMWAVGTSVHSMVLGRLGDMAVAATAVTNIVQQLATIVIFGIANAATVVVGRYVGEGDPEYVQDVAKTFRVMSYILGVVSIAIIMLMKDFVIALYNLPEETYALTQELMVVTSIIVFFIANTGISIVGILRGGGDAKFSLYIELITLWGISVPLGLITGLWLKLPIIVVFACMKLDEPAKMLIATIRMRGSKWIKDVTRDKDEQPEPIPEEVPVS